MYDIVTQLMLIWLAINYDVFAFRILESGPPPSTPSETSKITVY